MKNKPKKVVSKSSINSLTIILGLGGLGFFYLAYFLIRDGLAEEFPQIWPIGLGGFFGVFGLFCFYTLFTYDKIYIPKTEKANTKPSYFSTIKTKTYFAMVFFLVGLFSLYISLRFYIDKSEEVFIKDLTTLTDVISNKVEIHKGSKGSKSIFLYFKNYSDFQFQISGIAYSAMNTDKFIDNVKQGDTISVAIKTDEFHKKIIKEKELGFYDKSVNYGIISVFELSDKNLNYLDLYDYNKQNISDKPWGIGMYGLLGFFLIGTSIYLMRLKENE